MAKVHVLEQQGANLFRCIVHFAMPAGNNDVGVTWKAAYIAAGYNRPSSMSVGNAGHQATTQENNQLTSGDLIEAEFSFVYDPVWTTTEVNAALDAEAATRIASRTAELQALLRFYGYTRVV
jgi:hypothetical protein